MLNRFERLFLHSLLLALVVLMAAALGGYCTTAQASRGILIAAVFVLPFVIYLAWNHRHDGHTAEDANGYGPRLN